MRLNKMDNRLNKWKQTWIPKKIGGMVTIGGIDTEIKINNIYDNLNDIKIEIGFFNRIFTAIKLIVRYIINN